MATHMNLIDLDTFYHSLDRTVLLNNFNHLELDPDTLSGMLYSKYGNEISLIPQCECGYLKRNYLLGETCPKCSTTVIAEFDMIKPILWIKAYKENLPFLNPIYYGMLRNLFKRNTDPFRWLCDTGYNPPNIPSVMHSIAAIIGGRGYHNFINNIKKVLTYLKNHPTFKYTGKRKKVERLLSLYDSNRDLIYTNHLPLINKRLFVMEMTNKGDYTTNTLADVIDIAITAIKLSDSNINDKKLSNGVASIISKSNILFEKYIDEKIAKKPGNMRKHLYGSRSHGTFRGVITSFPSTLPYDELHAPWQILTTVYRPHVLNKLMSKHDYTHKKASNIIFESTLKYNRLINDIGKKLIEESPEKGLPVLFLRNPYLLMGSSTKRWVTMFKIDPIDTTISCSILGMKMSNADVDGDEMNCTALLDNTISNMANKLESHRSILDAKYFSVNKNISIPSTIVVNIANYMITPEEEDDKCMVYKELIGMD